MGIVFFRAMMGAVAGLAAWIICEPMFPKGVNDGRWGVVETLFIGLIGLFVGGALGYAQGAAQGSNLRKWQWAGIAAFLGFLGSNLGYRLGSALGHGIFPGVNFGNPNSSAFIEQMFARMTVIAPIGLLIGCGIGMCGFTSRRIMVGALGGLIGGAITGILFDPLSIMLSPLFLQLSGNAPVTGADGIPRVEGEIGAPGRAVMAIGIGLAVGLFTALLDRLTRSAWIRLVLGKNEGKEWVIDAPQSFLGRSEKAHVPLFGDPNVAPMHAMIQRNGPQYVLIDGGSPIGTAVNGQRVQQAALVDGSQIQIGPHVLTFMLRAGAAQRASEATRGAAAQPVYNPNVSDPQPWQATHQATQMPHPTQMAPQSMQPTMQVPAMPQAPIAPTLVAMDGPLAGQRFPVMGPMDVGREGGAIPLGFDTSVSRRHVQFAPAMGGLQVTDTGSTNGTFVNGSRVSSATIRPGDLVKIGITTFRVE